MNGGILKKTTPVQYRTLRAAAICYCGLPLLIFLCGFLRWYFAVPGAVAVGFSMFWLIRRDHTDPKSQKPVCFSVFSVLGILGICLIWTYLGGMNGYFYQTTDWNCRNPIYFDLIEFDWPVIYEKNGQALVYYIGHWLPPALLAKIVLLVTGSWRLARFMGRMFLWGWSSLGLTIVILLILCYLHANTKRMRAAAIAAFLAFSGMDIIGGLFNGKLPYLFSPEVLHLEWWSAKYQFTSMTACVFWVFNQSIVPWILTLCFLMDEDVSGYAFYEVAGLLCGPFPCVGLAVLMIGKAAIMLIHAIRDKTAGKMCRTIFSPANVLSVLLVFPFVAAYILANAAIGERAETLHGLMQLPPASGICAYVIFLIFEVGIYMAAIYPDHRKDAQFYVIAVTFLICPCIYVGRSNDFCMRASLPALMILMLYCIRFLFDHFPRERITRWGTVFRADKRSVAAVILLVCLTVGAVTPAVEVYRGFYHVITQRTFRLEDMSIGTFNSENVPANFACKNPEERVFFQFFARP